MRGALEAELARRPAGVGRFRIPDALPWLSGDLLLISGFHLDRRSYWLYVWGVKIQRRYFIEAT